MESMAATAAWPHFHFAKYPYITKPPKYPDNPPPTKLLFCPD